MERTADRCTLHFRDDFHTSTSTDARPRPPSLSLFSLDLGVKSLATLREADPELTPLVQVLHAQLTADPLRVGELKDALMALLAFLSSPRGRTHANCSAVDHFFTVDDTWVSDRLPDSFMEIMADISGALHDTVCAPQIARSFSSTPEQLLERARSLQI